MPPDERGRTVQAMLLSRQVGYRLLSPIRIRGIQPGAGYWYRGCNQ
jgi:hypothetical protein